MQVTNVKHKNTDTAVQIVSIKERLNVVVMKYSFPDAARLRYSSLLHQKWSPVKRHLFATDSNECNLEIYNSILEFCTYIVRRTYWLHYGKVVYDVVNLNVYPMSPM